MFCESESTQPQTMTLSELDLESKAESAYWAIGVSTSDPPLPEDIRCVYLQTPESVITFGRNPTNTVVLSHPGISRQLHCTVRVHPDDSSMFLVRDHSTNGTFIERQLIGHNQERILRANEELMLLRAPEQVRLAFLYTFSQSARFAVIYRTSITNSLRIVFYRWYHTIIFRLKLQILFYCALYLSFYAHFYEHR